MNQDCPLCDTPATYAISHDPYCKHFTCTVCNEFFIDGPSERYVGEFVEVQKTEFRKKLSDAARATLPSQIFVIREPLPEERSGDGHQVARKSLVAKHLNRLR